MLQENTLLGAVKIFILASFFTPLIILKEFYFPFIVPKTSTFQILIELALFFYILLAISNKDYRPKLDALSKSIVVFLGVYTLAAIFGENIFRSFFGNFERMLGIFNLAHFVALFFMIKAIFIKERDWIWLFRAFVFAGFLVAVYAVFQKMGASFVYNAGTNRIDSTIGNAAFFAAYMMFNAFFAIFLLIKDKTNFKYFYQVALFLSLTTLYLSSTRGAILGSLVAFLFFGAMLLFKNRKNIKGFFNPKKNKAFNFVLIGLSLFLIVAFSAPEAFLDPIKRISSISLSDSTTNTRILSAGVSWEGVKEHPILGVGMENYNLIFDKYYDSRLYPTENWFDHAHNIIFDTLASAGFVGLISYFVIFFVALRMLLRHKKEGEEDDDNYIVSYFFISLFIAYFLQNLFVFDALVTYLSFFIVLAYVAFLGSKKGYQEVNTLKKAQIPVQVVVLLVVVFGTVMYGFTLKPAMGAYYGIQAIKVSSKNPDIALESFKKAIDITLQGKAELRSKMSEYAGRVLKEESVSNASKIKFLNFTKEEALKTIKQEPKDVRHYMYLSGLMYLDTENKDFLREMKEVMNKAVDLGPNKPPVYLTRYQLDAFLGDFEDGVKNLEKAKSLTKLPLEIELLLAERYIQIGKIEEAVGVYDEILKRENLDSQTLVNISIILAKLGEKERAVAVAQRVIDLQGETVDALKFIEDVRSGKFK